MRSEKRESNLEENAKNGAKFLFKYVHLSSSTGREIGLASWQHRRRVKKCTSN
jgi:hypothetical protein